MRIESGSPISVAVDGSTRKWQSVDLADRFVNEDWLRSLVFKNPECLPISLIDPAFGPLIPLGKEVPTTSGPIDALYISPDGAITILEAKLWRNPQARREVVGQIIDYATAVSRWSLEHLEDISASNADSSLWELAKEHSNFGTEHEFHDALARNLKRGRFLLLIVGDGIREEVEQMVDYVQSAPQLQFTLALVELKLFERADRERLVVPSIIARTEEVTRAVVEVELAEHSGVHVEVSVPVKDESTGRQTLSEAQLFDAFSEAAGPELARFAQRVREDFDSEPRFVVENKAGSFVVKLKQPHRGDRLTVMVFNIAANVHPGWTTQQLPKAGVPVEIGHRYVADIAALLGAEVRFDDPQWWVASRPLEEVRKHYDIFYQRTLDYADEVYAAIEESHKPPPELSSHGDFH